MRVKEMQNTTSLHVKLVGPHPAPHAATEGGADIIHVVTCWLCWFPSLRAPAGFTPGKSCSLTAMVFTTYWWGSFPSTLHWKGMLLGGLTEFQRKRFKWIKSTTSMFLNKKANITFLKQRQATLSGILLPTQTLLLPCPQLIIFRKIQDLRTQKTELTSSDYVGFLLMQFGCFYHYLRLLTQNSFGNSYCNSGFSETSKALFASRIWDDFTGFLTQLKSDGQTAGKARQLIPGAHGLTFCRSTQGRFKANSKVPWLLTTSCFHSTELDQTQPKEVP